MDFIKFLKSVGASIAAKAREALNWYKGKVDSLLKPTAADKVFRKTGSPEVGKMYIYVYDPKWKEILPFYDMYPLVIPIEYYSNGFLGLNLHYLPPLARAQLLTALMKEANNDKHDETTKLNISYGILKGAATQYSGFENCVKRYLYNHVRSNFFIIDPKEWDKVVLLPLQRWIINPNKKYAGRPPY